MLLWKMAKVSYSSLILSSDTITLLLRSHKVPMSTGMF